MIASARPLAQVMAVEQGVHLRPAKVTEQPFIGPLGRDGQHARGDAHAGRIADGHHPKERMHRRQPYITRLGLIVSLALQVIQETQDRRGIHIEGVERRGCFAGGLLQKLQQEPEGVAVAFHRSNTRSLLAIKVIDEEGLQQRPHRRQASRCYCLHGWPPWAY